MDIGIVGLGLIGGSLGLDFKVRQTHRVLGVSRRPSTCERAIERGAVDDASTDLASLKGVEVIFICTPIVLIQPTAEKLAPHLSPDTILTDVGSVKAPVVQAMDPVWQNFVGGHPMAGTAESGIDAALRDLFVDRAYVITPTEKTPPDSVKVVESLARSLQSRLYTCTPTDHDRAVAWISHLPVMVSASLIAACMGEDNLEVLKLAQAFASSGFRDTSRVGGGNPELGIMMARYNKDALVRSLHAFQAHLTHATTLIETENWQDLETLLTSTQRSRLDFVE